jgi:hypothetical protein
MSHVSGVKTRIHDIDALEAGCVEMGWTFNRNKHDYRWWGSWVDDSPVPEHLFSPEEYKRIVAMSSTERKAHMTEFLGRCDHSITIPGADFEIAVRELPDGSYTLGFDWFGQEKLLKAVGGKDAPKLVQAYAHAKVLKDAERYGHLFESEKRLEDGSIKVRLLASRY